MSEEGARSPEPDDGAASASRKSFAFCRSASASRPPTERRSTPMPPPSSTALIGPRACDCPARRARARESRCDHALPERGSTSERSKSVATQLSCEARAIMSRHRPTSPIRRSLEDELFRSRLFRRSDRSAQPQPAGKGGQGFDRGGRRQKRNSRSRSSTSTISNTSMITMVMRPATSCW